MTQQFRRDIGSLSSIYAFVTAALLECGAGNDVCYSMNLAVEELFTNMVKYNPEGGTDIPVTVEQMGRKVLITLSDRAAASFDVTRGGEPNLDLPLELRKPGGLGLYLVRKIVEDLKYDFHDGEIRISFAKTIR